MKSMTPKTRELLGATFILGANRLSKIANKVDKIDDVELLSSMSTAFEASFRAARKLALNEAKKDFANLGLPVPKISDISTRFSYGNTVVAGAAANISKARAQIFAGVDRDVVIRDLKKRLAAGLTAGATRAYNQTLLDLYVSIEAQTNKKISKTWNSVNDNRTCALCRQMHGKSVGLFDLFYTRDERRVFFDALIPPAHPLCRCWISFEFLD